MAQISHKWYLENITFQTMVRKMRDFLVTEQAKAGYMWTKVWEDDTDVSNEFTQTKFGFILSHDLKKTVAEGTAPKMYVKVICDPAAGSIQMLASCKHTPEQDNNLDLKLTESIVSHGEDDYNTVIIRDDKGVALNPAGNTIGYSPKAQGILVPTLYLPQGFNTAEQKLSKVWLIRRLAPMFDEVELTKLTDIYAWCSFCIEEAGGTESTPLDMMGWYSHWGFGMCGEQLVPDATFTHGAGLYTCVTSFANKAKNTKETGVRVYAGGGVDPAAKPTNVGAVFCAGMLDQRIPKQDVENDDMPIQKLTWFYVCPAYGQARSPFDEKLFGYDDNHAVGDPHNVGFDYTELCKYSPYSGVRVLTPAYEYGMYNSLYRVLGRIPVFYTQLTGLYAGDTISQEVDGVTKDYLIFPFINYRCLQEMQAKRGHAIFVPAAETV